MLYYLFYPLHEVWIGFNIFKYITFRAAYAGALSLVLTLLFGRQFIRWASKRGLFAQVREKGIPSQETKTQIPTMGGLLILSTSVFSVLLWADIKDPFIITALLSFISLGMLGFWDDFKKIKTHNGLTVRQKLVLQGFIGLCVGIYVFCFPKVPNFRDYTTLLFLKNIFIYLGWFYIPFVVIVILATANSMNLTDGLDGLATGLIGEVLLAYAVLAYVVGNSKFSGYLNILYIPSSGELTVFLGSIIGSTIGFLWFNAHPSQIIMGDTGSLSLGGIVGIIAIMLKQEVLLLIACGPFVIEALSVILQVAYFKKTHGKRLFRMAPLHHHYEKLGIPEQKIVVRFWIIGILFLLIALSTLKIR